MPGCKSRLQSDLRAELNNAVGRQIEVIGDAVCIAEHTHKQLLAPIGHFGITCCDQRFLADKERRGHGVEFETMTCTQLKLSGDIQVILEPIAHQNPEKAVG